MLDVKARRAGGSARRRRWAAGLLGVAVIVGGLVSAGPASATVSAENRTWPHSVSPVPDAPGTSPSGGWQLEYGDGFASNFGTGENQDNTLYPNRETTQGCADDPGFNSNEMEVFNCSQVRTDRNGLHLTCSWSPNRWPAGAGAGGDTTNPQVNYVCGTVHGIPTSLAPGYRPFAWQSRQGESWAFQCVCRLPENTGEADPGWWSSDYPWTQELDYFEGWGWTGTSWADSRVTTPTWVYVTSPFTVQDVAAPLPFDPAAAYHTYTTVINADNTYEEFFDGKLQTQFGNQGVMGPVPDGASPYMQLLLSYALREKGGADPSAGFTSGSRSFDIKSISVYENASAHGANTQNAGLAPGTHLIGRDRSSS